jgi:hypothetical protein
MATSSEEKLPAGNDLPPDLAVRVEPIQMVQFVHDLMTTPDTAGARWGADTAVARAARLRWDALNRAFGDSRVSTWTSGKRRNQIHVPAALIAAAGVARLTVEEKEGVVFDIPTLLDATLELCTPAGHA